jgi:hypothetical protein
VKLFAKFKKWGFDSVELPIEDPSHIDPVKVRAALDKAGLACGSICACMGPGRDFRGTPEEQQTAMTYCKTLIDQAVIIGCPSIIGPVYSVVGKADAVEPAQQKIEWALVVKNLKELCAYAESKGIQICVEPLNRFETDFLNTCDQGLKLIKAVKGEAGVEKMPKKGSALSAPEIAALEKWIAEGLPWPEGEKVAEAAHGKADPKQHWAFLPVVKPVLPTEVKGGNAIDVLVGAKLKAAGLDFSKEADAATLYRRLCLTVTGLQPEMAEVKAGAATVEEGARAVDRKSVV